jgi:hypothetical protein
MWIPLFRGDVMRGTNPAPLVPEMPTNDDETRTRETELRADGGDDPRHEPFGAPLVPDSS